MLKIKKISFGKVLAASAFCLSSLIAQAATPHLDAVESNLRSLAPGSEGSVWERTSGNSIAGKEAGENWLLQSPNCWGDVNCSNANGAQALADVIYKDLAAAEQWIDITTLAPYPDGVFQTAIVNGITVALQKNPDVMIRILGGTAPGSSDLYESAEEYFDRLTADLGVIADNANIMVSGVTTSWLYSWNHSKIIAVDSKTAIVGGHNLWEGAYGDVTAPVSDLSMHVNGAAAESAHKFADLMWDFACTYGEGWYSLFYVDLKKSDSLYWGCPTTHTTTPVASAPGTTDVLALGGLGFGVDVPGGTSGGLAPANDLNTPCSGSSTDYVNNESAYTVANPEEAGLRALIASATDNIFISQQDLIAPCLAPYANAYYDARLFDILADKLIAEIPVRIMVSTPGATQGGMDTYSYMDKLTEISDILLRKVEQRAGVTAAQAKTRVCNSLQLATIRVINGVNVWSDGTPIGNHAKSIFVDDAAYYIGSKNLYPTTLQDFGFMVEDATAAAEYKAEYKDRSWAEAKSSAIADFETGTCQI